MFFPPSLLYSFLVASLIGLGFFLVAGGESGWSRMALYWVVALLSFWVGQTLATGLNVHLMPVGPVDVLEASAVCLVSLFGFNRIERRFRA